jgi:hypothetical protein
MLPCCRAACCLQDYYYVRGFTPFAGSLLASAPDSHLETIVGGIAALTDELAWFKDTAQKRGCDVTIIGEAQGMRTKLLQQQQQQRQ